MTHRRESGFAVVAAAAFVLLAGSLLMATPPTTTFDLTGVQGDSLAGVYTSPYYAKIGATITAKTPTVPVICDDFSDNSYIPEEWTVYETSLASLPTTGTSNDTTLKWSGATSIGPSSPGGIVDGYSWSITNQYTAYAVAADLVLQIMNPSNTVRQQEDDSYALWELFDANGAAVYPGGTLNWGTAGEQVVSSLGSSSGDLLSATNDLKAAISAVTTPGSNPLNGHSVTIYSFDPAGMTPTCNPPGANTCSSVPPQEFITVPEPSSLAVFAVYLLFGGVTQFFFRRRRMLKKR